MELSLPALLMLTAHVQRNAMRPVLDAMGLSYGQPKVLRCLALLGPCSQSTLARHCEVDPAAISRMLESMERNGLICRTPSPNDRRSGEVTLTDKGKTAYETWEERLSQFEKRLFAGFSAQQRAQFAHLLTKAYHNAGGQRDILAKEEGKEIKP